MTETWLLKGPGTSGGFWCLSVPMQPGAFVVVGGGGGGGGGGAAAAAFLLLCCCCFFFLRCCCCCCCTAIATGFKHGGEEEKMKPNS